jgi:hypothetical protein
MASEYSTSVGGDEFEPEDATDRAAQEHDPPGGDRVLEEVDADRGRAVPRGIVRVARLSSTKPGIERTSNDKVGQRFEKPSRAPCSS